jgi:hypothetical protein
MYKKIIFNKINLENINRCIFLHQFLTQKTNTMKKVLALMAIVGFVACNNAETKTEAVDSTKIKDSLAAAAAQDTTAKAVDTTAKAVDTAAKK